jgi:hypothetical protein
MVAQEVRWAEGGSQPADDFTFFYANENANHHLGQAFSYIRESDQQLMIGCHI